MAACTHLDTVEFTEAGCEECLGGHPTTRSIEPGEDWSWCVVDELAPQLPSGA